MGLDRPRGGGHAFPGWGTAIETQLANTTKSQFSTIHASSMDGRLARPTALLGGQPKKPRAQQGTRGKLREP